MNEAQDLQKSPASQRSTTELIRDLGDQLTDLIRTELRLAQRELQNKGKEAGKGVTLFGAAGVIALLGVLGVLTGAVLALALVVPAWLSALIVGAGLLLAAAVVALAGRSRLKKSTPLMPEDAIGGSKWDARTLKEATKK